MLKWIRFQYGLWQINKHVDDCCCCGDSMTNHAHPYDCGHSPVSQKSYAILKLHERIYRGEV